VRHTGLNARDAQILRPQQGAGLQGLPLPQCVAVMCRVHLVHARIEQSCDLQSGRIRGCPETGIFRHGQEESTASTGTPAPKARPCTTEQAVRKPVNEPGPLPKQMASSWPKPTPASASIWRMAAIKSVEALAPPALWCSTTRVPSAPSVRSAIEKFSSGIQGQQVHARIIPAGAAPDDAPMHLRRFLSPDSRHLRGAALTLWALLSSTSAAPPKPCPRSRRRAGPRQSATGCRFVSGGGCPRGCRAHG